MWIDENNSLQKLASLIVINLNEIDVPFYSNAQMLKK